MLSDLSKTSLCSMLVAMQTERDHLITTEAAYADAHEVLMSITKVNEED
jgi:hypothetical protein